MAIPSTNETEILRAQSEVVVTARDILSGALAIVTGARRLTKLSFDLGMDRDPDFTFFIGVDSQTDHLPLGDVRHQWSADALREKDEELRGFEVFFRDEAFRVCQSLVQRYDKPGA